MRTCLKQAGAASVAEAARLLRAGEVVGIPTETVYGLAANALSDEAVPKIFAAKGRPQDNPLISHIASLDMLPMVVREVPGAGEVQRDSRLGGCLGDQFVAHRAARVDDRLHTGGGQRLQPVGEREEGVTGGDRPAHPLSAAFDGQPGRVVQEILA